MNAKQVLEAIRREILNERGVDVEEINSHEPAEWGFSFRYFGTWEMPEGEEDDGDYDWKIPTAATRARLETICAKHATKTVSVAWHFEGEKFWLRFTARAK